jgi:hypothetical protein
VLEEFVEIRDVTLRLKHLLTVVLEINLVSTAYGCCERISFSFPAFP